MGHVYAKECGRLECFEKNPPWGGDVTHIGMTRHTAAAQNTNLQSCKTYQKPGSFAAQRFFRPKEI